MAVFDKSSPIFNLSKDTLTADKYELNGIVKDLPSTLREYRVYLEVEVEGERYAFSWDKRYQVELLSGFNREPPRLDKVLDFLDSSSTPVDTLVDDVKERATDAPPPDTNDQSQRDRRRRLRDAEISFGASTIAPDIGTTPTDPSDPQESADAATSMAWNGQDQDAWDGGPDGERVETPSFEGGEGEGEGEEENR